MESYAVPFVKMLLLVPVTLLPIINPLSSAPVFAATVGSNRAIAGKLARQVAINAWFVLVASMLIGTYVLALFGISLPVVRIGGGLLVAATAWRLLHHTEDDDVHAAAAQNAATLSDAEIVEQYVRRGDRFHLVLKSGSGEIASPTVAGFRIPIRAIFDPAENLATLRRYMTA